MIKFYTLFKNDYISKTLRASLKEGLCYNRCLRSWFGKHSHHRDRNMWPRLQRVLGFLIQMMRNMLVSYHKMVLDFRSIHIPSIENESPIKTPDLHAHMCAHTHTHTHGARARVKVTENLLIKKEHLDWLSIIQHNLCQMIFSFTECPVPTYCDH